jgi:MYXO-CTERM domain-containing protein
MTLHDQAAFRPALTSTPGGSSNGKNLAGTGMPAGVAIMALLLLGAGLVTRRRVLTLD